MLVSIITVCYNSEATIRKTIESVLAQSYDSIEYLIIDGASRDHTVKIAEEYINRFKERGFEYRVISEPDQGLYDAMNKGIELAHGEVIGLINSDDWYEPNAVRTVAEAYRENHFDMFFADLRILREDGSTLLIKHSRMDYFPTSRHWNHPTTFITKKTYEEIGTFRWEQEWFADFDLYLRIRRANKHIVIKNCVLANFRRGGVTTTKSIKACVKWIKEKYHCYRSNGYGKLSLLDCAATEIAKFVVR